MLFSQQMKKKKSIKFNIEKSMDPSNPLSYVFPQSETSVIASLMSGFLHYSHNPRMVQRVWAVLPRTEPTVLYLYAAPQVLQEVTVWFCCSPFD